MIYIRPFKKEDFLAFVPIEPLPESEVYDKELGQAIEDSGLAVTGIRDGKIIGCGGVHPMLNSNRGELWLRISKECLKHKIESLRTLKRGFEIIEETYPFDCFDAVIRCCLKQSVKMVKMFGFKPTEEVFFKGEKWVILTKENHANYKKRDIAIE